MSPPSGSGPERAARARIDEALSEAGWIVQDRDQMNVHAGRGVAVREFRLASGHGFVDYMLFVEGKAAGILEAKPVGHTLTGVEIQAQRYAAGLPRELTAPIRPLPFLYLSTGEVTSFTNLLDPHPRSRPIFRIHRPETLTEWLGAEPVTSWARGWSPLLTTAEPVPTGVAYVPRPSTLRARLQHLPPLDSRGLWPNQVRGLTNLERSLREDRPRALGGYSSWWTAEISGSKPNETDSAHTGQPTTRGSSTSCTTSSA